MSFDDDSSFNIAQAMGKDTGPRNYVKFYRQWVRNNFKSKEAGVEVGEHQDFILIICPGQPKTEVRRKASDADKMAYMPEWSAYEQGKEHQMSGTPIETLPGLANGMADALKALYIYTIEQMAGLPDIALQKVGMGGNEIRQRAKAYIEKSSAEVIALKSQLEEAQATIAELRGQIAQYANAANTASEARKPGRKPRLKAVA